MVKNELTLKKVRKLLSYDPGVGIFRWKVREGSELTGGMRDGLVGGRAGRINGNGYREIEIGGERVRASRLAWFYVKGEWPRDQIDHINHVTWDDRLENLREASLVENCRNRGVVRDGLKGVYFGLWKKKGLGMGKVRRSKPWRARIEVLGRKVDLGWHRSEVEAHEAYCRAAREHFGEYACMG